MRRYFYVIKMSRACPNLSSNSTARLQTQVIMDWYHKHADDIRKPQCKKKDDHKIYPKQLQSSSYFLKRW